MLSTFSSTSSHCGYRRDKIVVARPGTATHRERSAAGGSEELQFTLNLESLTVRDNSQSRQDACPKPVPSGNRRPHKIAVCLLFAFFAGSIAGEILRSEPLQSVTSQFPGTATGPQARTRAELDAFGRVMESQAPADIITAAEAFVSHYAQSELLPMVRLREMQAEMDVNSYEGATATGHELLSENPRNLEALLLMADILPDFPPRYAARRGAILAEARKDIQSAGQLLQTFHLPQGASPEEFLMNKQRLAVSLAEATGFLDLVAEQYEGAIRHYRWAVVHGGDPSPAALLRLGQAYSDVGDVRNARLQWERAMRTGTGLIRQKAAELLKNTEGSQSVPKDQKP